MTSITEVPTIYQLAIYDLLGSKLMCDMWWNGSNVAFNFKTPLEQWSEDKQVVINHIIKHCN